MANVLGELFGDIADAIREKTGGTGTMKPNEFPDNIRAIEAGGGSGGGTLPKGLYWTQNETIKPYAGIHRVFVFNNKVHLLCLETSSDSTYSIFRLDGDTYTKIFDTPIISGYYIYNYSIVEYHGMVHFIGGGYKKHYVWDGISSPTEKNALPANTGSRSAFVVEDTLYIRSKQNGFYKWNETDSVWEALSISGVPSGEYYSLEYAGYIYTGSLTTLYRTDVISKTCEVYDTLDISLTGNVMTVFNGKIYISRLNYKLEIYEYDVANKECRFVGNGPQVGLYYVPYVYDGCYHISGGSNTYHTDMTMHEISSE